MPPMRSAKRDIIAWGYTGGIANAQYDYDHRQDSALFLDSDFVQRKLRDAECLRKI